MKITTRRLGLLLTALVLCLMLGGCSLIKGNNRTDIDEAIRLTEEQYGIDLTLKKKKLFTGGATCDVTVRCEELPGENIRVFRFNDRSDVQCDYIYLKYGDQAYERICEVVHTTLPEAKVIVEESGYNHFYGNTYDKDTDLDFYLWNNQFKIDVVTSGDYDEAGIRSLYDEMANALIDNGIDSYGFAIYVMDSEDAVAAVKTYERMPDSQAYRGVSGDGIKIYAAKSHDRLSEYVEKSDEPNALYIRIR